MRNLIKVYFEPYRRSVIFIILLLILQVIFQITIINAIKPIIAKGIDSLDTEIIFSYGVFMLILIILYSVTTIIVSRKAARISADSVSRIREDMFKKILSFKRPRDSGANMSGLMNRLVTDVNNVQNYITEFLCMGLYVPLLALGTIIVTAMFSPFLCAAFTISFVVMCYIIFHLAKGELKVRSKLQRFLDRTIHMFTEILTGSRTARAYDMEKEQHEIFTAYNTEYSKLVTDTTVKVSRIASFSTLVLIIVIVLVYVGLTTIIGELDLSPDELIIFIQYLVLFITCAGITPFIITTTPLVRASLGRISKVMNGESESSGRDVPAEYEGPILRCTNGLEISEGTEVSLIGRTGSGKSELIRSLLRLEDVGPAEIFFKGVDITELDPKDLRRSIAYAGDKALVFGGTVRDNITVWRDIPEERLRKAIESADIDMDMDLILDRTAANISRGKIQKISIARALATDADLYIFDDCFTELDPKKENEIVSNIRGMLKGKTVLFVSHQFRISPDSDKVSVMENGRIIDTGMHEDLLEGCDTYRRMYMTGGGMID